MFAQKHGLCKSWIINQTTNVSQQWLYIVRCFTNVFHPLNHQVRLGHPSIFYTHLFPFRVTAGVYPANEGREQGTPRTDHQSIARPHKADINTHSQLRVYYEAYVWTVDGSRSTKKATHAEGEHALSMKKDPSLDLNCWTFKY